MSPNPTLAAIGLKPTDRAVIFHADDIGMCQSTISAYADLLDFGLISAAATMTPCSWFPAAAALCRAADGPVDMGAHLTLTSEWSTYRWRPVSATAAADGLLDQRGYFPQAAEPVQRLAQAEAVGRELTAQVAVALAAGVDVTHVDSHMGTLFHPRLLPYYLEVADRYEVPALLFRDGPMLAAWLQNQAADPAALRALIAEREQRGYPLLDHLEGMSLDNHADRVAEATMRLARLPAGISYFIVHPAQDSPELRAIAPDWRARVADYHLFTSEAWRHVVTDSGVQVIGYEPLRARLRQL